MTRILVIVTFAVLLFIPTFTFADKVVRDRNGTLVETWHDSNGRTDVRDRNGSLIGTEQRTNLT